ncbi:MAG TPA: hypothetical protein VF549_09115 [Solirubrobacteraceae bacterium]|jgi:hypothetical protein
MLRLDPFASHGTHPLPDPRQSGLLLGILALLLALVVMAAAAPDLGVPSLSFGGHTGSATALTAPATVDPGTPAWVSDPLRPPVERLAVSSR